MMYDGIQYFENLMSLEVISELNWNLILSILVKWSYYAQQAIGCILADKSIIFVI